jgi:hypothetical protein
MTSTMGDRNGVSVSPRGIHGGHDGKCCPGQETVFEDQAPCMFADSCAP